jgi:hypothetical protein
MNEWSKAAPELCPQETFELAIAKRDDASATAEMFLRNWFPAKMLEAKSEVASSIHSVLLRTIECASAFLDTVLEFLLTIGAPGPRLPSNFGANITS